MTNNDKPHCWGKMYWKLDNEKENPTNMCDCKFGAKKCLSLTIDTALKLNAEIEELKENGKLDVFNPKLKQLFYDR